MAETGCGGLCGPRHCVGGFAMAASDLGKQREADMKAIGGALKTASGLPRARKPSTLPPPRRRWNDRAKATEFPTLFPEGSEKADGGASPKIWENKADFERMPPSSPPTRRQPPRPPTAAPRPSRPPSGTVAANCKSCHQLYRLSD